MISTPVSRRSHLSLRTNGFESLKQRQLTGWEEGFIPADLSLNTSSSESLKQRQFTGWEEGFIPADLSLKTNGFESLKQEQLTGWEEGFIPAVTETCSLFITARISSTHPDQTLCS
jgi:hypothetical protein